MIMMLCRLPVLVRKPFDHRSPVPCLTQLSVIFGSRFRRSGTATKPSATPVAVFGPNFDPTALPAMHKSLYQSLNIYSVGQDSYVVENAANDAISPALSIQRASGALSLEVEKSSLSATGTRPLVVHGILGLISLTTSEYLIVITGREPRGLILGHQVFRATSFDLLPIQSSVSSTQTTTEAYLLALVKAHLNNSQLWFSYTWDLTRRLQAQYVARNADKDKAIWETTDDRFFWNKHLHSRFIAHTEEQPDQDLSPFILPMICGTFDLRSVSINSRSFEFALISRRSRYRAGTRYFRRGADHAGHVANFNETEQIVIVSDSPTKSVGSIDSQNFGRSTRILSYVQTRGSIPLYWAEVNNLRYKPDLQVMELQDTDAAIQAHLDEQLSLYGPQILVNLLKGTGRERHVKDAFEKHISGLGYEKVRYEHFDFHKECKGMRFDRVSLLIDKLAQGLVQQGYFDEDGSGSHATSYQIGTVRTNCMDNLDRTNVVQSALAKWTLTTQLREVGILDPSDRIEMHENFMKDYRNMWADHGNSISTSYGGSDALKSDFTRTGKRTMQGLLWDGYSATMRYVKNNFFDGPRQDAFDLITGSWVARRGRLASASVLVDDRPLLIRSVPYILYIALFMICAGLTLPRSSDLSLAYYFIFCLLVATLAITFIVLNGIEYVSWPRLVPLSDVIEYDGPGNGSAKRGRGMARNHKKGRAYINGSAIHGRARSLPTEVEKGKKRTD